jgi:hypothetical protein
MMFSQIDRFSSLIKTKFQIERTHANNFHLFISRGDIMMALHKNIFFYYERNV